MKTQYTEIYRVTTDDHKLAGRSTVAAVHMARGIKAEIYYTRPNGKKVYMQILRMDGTLSSITPVF
jgi:hypothetical protein